MPKLVDYNQMRLEISKTALDVFFKKGYYQTNLNDVAKEHGVGRTTLYQYFKNKEELYVFSMKAWAGHMVEGLEKGLQGIPEGKEQVLFIMREMLSLKHHCNLIFLTIEQMPSFKERNSEVLEELNHAVEKVKSLIESALEKAKGEGYHPKMSINAMVSMLYALIEGFVIETTVTAKKTIDECINTSREILDGLM